MSIVNSFFKKNLINKGVNRYNPIPISVANYSPHKYFNNVLYISGQLPMVDGKLKYIGKRRGSDLVILDAKHLKELAVYELPISIPHGLHGSWVN